MRDYVLITDSTTDLPINLIKDLNIEVLPLGFSINEKTYLNYPDERDLDHKTFYKMLRSGIPSNTSLINSTSFMKAFQKHLNENKDILYISFSSGLSGTFNSSNIAIDMLKESNPDKRIVSIDSLSASMGEGLIVYYAAKLMQEGKTMDEVIEWVENNKLKLCHWFTVDDLHHLKRGGRVSTVTATIGSILNIKPILHVDNNGHLIPMEKVRGRKQSILNLLNKMKETAVNIEDQVIFISHGDALEDADYLASQIKKEFPVKDIIINTIGPVIGSHSGPGTIALFFLGSHR